MSNSDVQHSVTVCKKLTLNQEFRKFWVGSPFDMDLKLDFMEFAFSVPKWCLLYFCNPGVISEEL